MLVHDGDLGADGPRGRSRYHVAGDLPRRSAGAARAPLIQFVDEYGIVPRTSWARAPNGQERPGPAFPWVRFFELMEAEVSKYEDLGVLIDLAQDEDLRVKARESILRCRFTACILMESGRERPVVSSKAGSSGER